MKREDLELVKYFDWVAWELIPKDRKYKLIHHVENERACSWKAGKSRKRKGVRAGILDINCPIPVAKYPGLWIELKIKPNKLTEEQTEIATLLHEAGHCVKVAWSGEDCIAITKWYLALPK